MRRPIYQSLLSARTVAAIAVAAISVAVIVLGPLEAEAISSCAVKRDKNTGVLAVSAVGVVGPVSWSSTAISPVADFFNAATCNAGGRLRDCYMADPASPAARLTPSTCEIAILDQSGGVPCTAPVPGCRPPAEHRGPDGVVQIDEHQVYAGGITPTDGIGYPVEITVPGRYRLAGNLDLRSSLDPENVSAIVIRTNDVVLDFNGFNIIGPVECENENSGCSASGTGIGVSSSSGGNRITIENGGIYGMGDDAIELLDNITVRNMVLRNNAGGAITASAYALIENNVIVDNGVQAINVGPESVVQGNVVQGTYGVGIGAALANVRNNIVADSAGSGISVAKKSTVAGNFVVRNSTGIVGQDLVNVIDNLSFDNEANGIAVNEHSNVSRNVLAHNGTSGLRSPAAVGYGMNVFARNASGPVENVTGAPVQLGINACEAGACP